MPNCLNGTVLIVHFFVFPENCLAIDSIIVMVNMCHRVDHFLSNINTLYRSKTVSHYFNKDIYLLGRNSLTWLLQAGLHRIHVPHLLRLYPEKNYVGFFPLGSPCEKCTTTGLKWNIRRFLILLHWGVLQNITNIYIRLFLYFG